MGDGFFMVEIVIFVESNFNPGGGGRGFSDYNIVGMKDLVIGKEINERTVLVGLITQRQNEAKVGEYLDELEFLADTAGAEVVCRFTQKLEYPNPRTFVGQGKLAELREYVEKNDIGMVIFDDDLSTKQIANIEKELQVKILDRSSLILDLSLIHI